MTTKTQCGADNCDDTPYARCSINILKTKEGYSFHLCKKHYDIYCKTNDYELKIELLS